LVYFFILAPTVGEYCPAGTTFWRSGIQSIPTLANIKDLPCWPIKTSNISGGDRFRVFPPLLTYQRCPADLTKHLMFMEERMSEYSLPLKNIRHILLASENI
jgi:hypothetical protein